MPRIFCLACAMAVLTFAASPARADDRQDCSVANIAPSVIAACTRLIESGRDSGTRLAAYMMARAIGYSRQGRWPEAIADLTETLRIDPTIAAAYLNRGLAHARLSQLDRAITDQCRALALDPDLTEAWLNRGIALSLQGQNRRALDDFAQALRRDPSAPAVYLNRGFVYAG